MKLDSDLLHKLIIIYNCRQIFSNSNFRMHACNAACNLKDFKYAKCNLNLQSSKKKKKQSSSVKGFLNITARIE